MNASDLKPVVDRKSGHYFVRIESIFSEWWIAHWNYTGQYWQFHILPGVRLKDDFFVEINPERILMPDEGKE